MRIVRFPFQTEVAKTSASAIVSTTRSSLRSFGACSDILDHILLWLAKWC